MTRRGATHFPFTRPRPRRETPLGRHPTGGITGYQLGNGQWRYQSFDPRGRPQHLTSGSLDLTYAYDGVGNVTSLVDPRPGHSQGFEYDALDRLTEVSGFSQAGFTYDALGNRTWGTDTNYAYNADSSRLMNTTGVMTSSLTYDANGNMTQDGQGTYTYDTNNQLQSASVAGNATTYLTDGDGQRVRRVTPSGLTQRMIRGAAGEVLSEYDGPLAPWYATPQWTRDSIYVGGQLIAAVRPGSENPIVEYCHTDALGSVRVVSDQAGQDLARYDYGAFGEGPGVTPAGEKQRFTGKERDAETFLDYFGARYYRNVLGRFTTVDPGHANASLTRPQGWNAYAYASNNPLRFVDPTGMSDSPISAAGESSSTESQTFDEWAGEYVWNNEYIDPQSDEGSAANVDRRARIAAIAQGYSDTGDRSMPYTAAGATCNLFVQRVIDEAGAPKPLLRKADGTRGAPSAAEWAVSKIPGWRFLRPGEAPQPGDVAARRHAYVDATGHSAIVVGVSKGGVVTAAAAHATQIGPDMSFQPGVYQGDQIAYRRYVGR